MKSLTFYNIERAKNGKNVVSFTLWKIHAKRVRGVSACIIVCVSTVYIFIYRSDVYITVYYIKRFQMFV